MTDFPTATAEFNSYAATLAPVDRLMLTDDLDIALGGGCPACDTEPDQMCAACGLCRCETHEGCTRSAIALRNSLNIPGTFEVHDRDGWVHATYAWSAFKDAETHVDRLNEQDPERGYTWTRVR